MGKRYGQTEGRTLKGIAQDQRAVLTKTSNGEGDDNEQNTFITRSCQKYAHYHSHQHQTTGHVAISLRISLMILKRIDKLLEVERFASKMLKLMAFYRLNSIVG